MSKISISNVYYDMATKAYQHLFKFSCGYDHPRDVIFSPASSFSDVNMYGIFNTGADFSKNITSTVGSYLIWRSQDTNKVLDIEDCDILDDEDQYEPRQIDTKVYLAMFDTDEKKLLAQKMLCEASLYWVIDNWYPLEKAYIFLNSVDDLAIDTLNESLDRYLEDEDIDEDDIFADLSEISEEELKQIMDILKSSKE